MAHVASWKKEKVKELADVMVKNPVVAIVDIYGIPSPQMQDMRHGMRKFANVMMTRNNLLLIAIDEAAKQRPGLEKLKPLVGGQCAIVATPMNPFKLFQQMEATKSKAPAKPGDIAPEDIVVKEGETPFKPGPIVGELQKAGIPAAIEGGKIVIRKDKVLVEKGHKVPEELAKILPKLEILPMIVGMDLKGAFEDGIVYQRDILNVPVGYYPTMLATAARNATALGVSIVYPTKQTIGPLLGKAYRGASAVGVKAAIPTKDTIGPLLAKARAEMLAIAAQVPGLEDDRLKQQLTVAAAPAPQEKKVEKKEEEKKPEVSEEEAAAGLSALFG
ncbi:MAG: 50S ribosomal protein L10 [Methanomassiliicoccus sp.]|jgi:large subunit ribosomal protein L10|nr:50S ribosomal protein L10 [Methanomassiliicoccus sp.]